MSKAKVQSEAKDQGKEETKVENVQSMLIANEASIADQVKHIIEVTIIKPGPAKVKISGALVNYTEEALRNSLPLWEGAACFCDHFNKSVRNIAGVFYSPWYDEGIKAKLRLIDDSLFHLINQIINDRAQNLPVPDVGISADIGIEGIPKDHTIEVQEITNVISADIVFSPAAGGSFDRVLNSIREQLRIEDSFHPEPDTTKKPDAQYEKRVRDLQSIADKLRAQVKNQQESMTKLQSDLSDAVSKHREEILDKHPEIPADLVTGNTIQELDASLAKALDLVEKIKQNLEETIPAGAPPRSALDVGSLSSTDKIKYGLRRR